MVYLEKSQPAPACLAVERTKANGDYKCGDVVKRLDEDFKSKCYLCEYKGPTTLNVEHLNPHGGDKDRKFDWNNLFLACGHCNNTKGAGYEGLLNCTDEKDRVDADIRYRFEAFPSPRVEIELVEDNHRTRTTRDLLLAVYNGTTKQKKLEATYIRDALGDEMARFYESLARYDSTEGDGEKDLLTKEIREHLDSASAFTAFKRWAVRGDERFKAAFRAYYPSFSGPSLSTRRSPRW
uniref:HNH endonuclease n=1 Tax=Candidatus Kentrum eta TaxID=2126337 RepID=A0A450UGF1_9GAMM|nr:MAG: HNH endonuclease [Candidatus Kentron sp. H]VFJ92687.1 MAG: HNH endonuclease [Candidatus Kentron sp. H]VFJ99482.1 MAG: HNH endonuclease [Candidatus Kentron sp. H]